MRAGVLATLVAALLLSNVTVTGEGSTIAFENVAVTTADGTTVTAILAYPEETTITQLVVFAHGRGKNVQDHWTAHALETAAHGVAVVATNYRDNEGFPTLSGAEDTIAATHLALARFPTVTEVTLFGVSMGGAISGVAIAEAPGLYDHWFAIEPVGNTLETYLEAKAVGDRAATDMEREAGGTPADDPDAYLQRTAFWRALAGELEVEDVTIVHALYDGLVPYDQSRELQAALRAHDLPVDLFTVLRENEGHSPGTTPLTHVKNAAGTPDPNEEDEVHLAGHASEEDRASLVMSTGLELLFEHLAGEREVIGHGEFVVDRSARGGFAVRPF